MKINENVLKYLSFGAEIVGSGGGGNTYPVESVLNFYLEHNAYPEIIDHDEIPDSSLIVGIAYLGSPFIMEENIPQGKNILLSLKMLEHYIGEKTYGIVPIEGAGVGALIPLIAAINSKIPVVDADGMGRAFPELSMTTFFLNEISITPLTISDDYGNVVVLEDSNKEMIEELIRGITVIVGGGAWVTAYPMTGEEIKKHGIQHTLTKNIRLGEIFLSSLSNNEKLQQLKTNFNAEIIAEGFVKKIFRYREGKFSKGDLYVYCLDERVLKISFQNEYLMISEENKIIATVPTIIDLLDFRSLRPISTEEVNIDDMVIIITLPAAHQWRSEKGLHELGPARFGYQL